MSILVKLTEVVREIQEKMLEMRTVIIMQEKRISELEKGGCKCVK